MQKEPKGPQILGLSPNEQLVLEALSLAKTPLLLSEKTRIPRPTIYLTLASLSKRGLVHRRIAHRKHYWERISDDETSLLLDSAEKALKVGEEERIRIASVENRTIILHKGSKAIKTFITSLLSSHKDERIFGLQSTEVGDSYERIFGKGGIDTLNDLIKKNRIILDSVLPNDYFSKMFARFGAEWASHFEGRSTSVRVIDAEYLNHAVDMLVFKSTAVFIIHHEELALEIKSPELVRLISSLLAFLKDHAKTTDANATLRTLMEKNR
ncbi:MAG: helix-turn-helix domain-containing protein [Patescibacteria group bacterium]